MTVQVAHGAGEDLAVATRAQNQIVARSERFDESVEHRKVVCPVTVEQQEVAPPGGFETPQARSTVSPDRLADDPRTGPLGLLSRAVRRAVVTHDDFARVTEPFQGRPHCPHATTDRRALVAARDHH